MKSWKQTLFSQKGAMVCIILGFLFLLFGSFWNAKTTEQEVLDVRVQAYTSELEKKTKDMISELDGVSDVHVLLTLEGSASYVYATADGSGGSRDYVLVNQNNTQTPVLLQEVLSDIRGISVVCKNGDRPEIKQKIIGLLTAAYGIPSNRVFVAGS